MVANQSVTAGYRQHRRRLGRPGRGAFSGGGQAVEEADEAPEGFDHATAAQIQQVVECGECGQSIPAGEWLWLLSSGDVEAADEVKVLCEKCGQAAGCGDVHEPDANGA